MISFRILGRERVEATLRKGEHIADELAPEMRKAVLYVHGQVPGYPGPPAGSSYARTGTLGRSVTAMQGQGPAALSRVEPFGKGVTGYVGTGLSYAPYVIDRRRQAWMHRGRFWTLQDVVEKAQSGITKILESGVQRIIDG